MISHSQESKVRVCPWSHIWLTLRRLCFKFSTHKTFSTLSLPLSRLIVPFPIIFYLPLSPKVTLPSFFFKVIKFVLYHVMWLDHILSTTHLSLLFCAWSTDYKNIDLSLLCSWFIFMIVRPSFPWIFLNLLLQKISKCQKLLQL